MSLLKKWTLDGLAIAGTTCWDSPASEMGVVTPNDGDGAGGGDDRNAGDGTADDVDDGQGADDDGGDEGDSGADARGRRDASADDGDDDQDDEDEHEDDDDAARPPEERLKKVLKAKRRLERKQKKFQPTAARLRELQEAGLSIDDLVLAHRQLTNMQRRLEDNPKLKALFGDEDGDDTGSSRAGRKAERESVKYPFKTDNESGQFFKKFHEDFHAHTEEFSGRLERLEKLLDGETRERRAERTSAAVKEWRTSADTAAKVIPEGFRDLFLHAVGGDMRRVLRGELRATPQQVIDHHLAKLRKKGAIGKDTKTRASEAAREQIARRNENLPRRPAGNGRPGPVKERTIPRMADYNRSLKQRFGGN